MEPADQKSSQRYLTLALALALLLSLPSLFQGFNTDDLLILSNLETWYPELSNNFDIYSSLIEHLDIPWWSATEMKVSFFRPLSAVLLHLDHGFFGRQVLLWRVHSLLWLALLLWMANRIYRRHLSPAVAGVALLLLALDESLSFTAGWISNRHALVAAALGCAALVAHRQWREDHWRPGVFLAILAYVASLAAGETGLAFLGYGFCYEILGRKASWKSRISGASITAAMLVAYVALYKFLGHGTRGVTAYVDPGTEPLHFLAMACYRIPLNLAGLLLAVPPDPMFSSRFGAAMVVAGLAAVAVAGVLVAKAWSSWPEAVRRDIAWGVGGAFLSLIPQAAVFPSHRQLLSPMIGVAPLLAILLVAAWTSSREHRGTARWSRRLVVGVLVLAHLLIAPLMRVVMQVGLDAFHESVVAVVAELPAFDEPKDLLLVKMPGLAPGFYGQTFYDDAHVVRSTSWSYLSTAPYDHVLRRIDDSTIELSVPDGEMLAANEDLVWSRAEEIHADRSFSTQLFDATILEMGQKGPTRVRFSFHSSLDRDDLYVAAWIDGTWVEVELPEPGEFISIEHIGDFTSIMG